MKKALALLVLAFALLSLPGCGGGERSYALAAGPEGLAAARVLGDTLAGGAVVRAASSKAALQQLAMGSCEFVVVTEAQLRDAVTGGNEFLGDSYLDLQRIDSMLLGVFLPVSKARSLDEMAFLRGRVVYIGQKGDQAFALAEALCLELALDEPLAVSAEEALHGFESGEWSAVTGLFLPGDETITKLGELGGNPLSITAFAEGVALPPSMALADAPAMLEGMEALRAPLLYGALVCDQSLPQADRKKAAAALTGLPIRSQQMPSYIVPEETRQETAKTD
ncbi:MAG: hypothetical protein LBU47_07550 [Christensenellaceae bacterium]|jgi:hypothetical protein|nr:hypothetical protein [Christensenellaceae bacterium]